LPFSKNGKKKKGAQGFADLKQLFFPKTKNKTTHVCLLEKIITQSVPLIDWFAVDRLMCDASLRFISSCPLYAIHKNKAAKQTQKLRK
jgi:hypothetical protein